MHCIKFQLPIRVRFVPLLRKTSTSNFEYVFDYKDCLEFEESPVIHKNFPETYYDDKIEISTEEFEDALSEFGKQLIEVSRKDFSMDAQIH